MRRVCPPPVGGYLHRVMELARRYLGMDVVFLTEFDEQRQVFQALAGDADSFAMKVGGGVPLDDTYCARMVAGSVPEAIPDTRLEPCVYRLPATAEVGIGSYIGVPVQLADGTVYGTLCCASHEPHPFSSRDVEVMRMLAELVGKELDGLVGQTRAYGRISTLLQQERVDIALQPIFDVRGGRCLGVEALSRFPVDQGPTQQVFETAYRVGLGLRLERLALGRAIALLPLLPADVYLSVNLTPAVVHALSWAVEHHTALMPRLVLEITEHAAVTSYCDMRDTLRAGREHGLRLAIDDAGAGFASLKHVVELRPDIVKIDRSLVDGVAGDPSRQHVVTAFVTLSHSQGAAVVAEGVERPDDLAVVRDLGVDAAQGYLLARPTTDRGELTRWLDAGRPVSGRPAGALPEPRTAASRRPGGPAMQLTG